MFRSFLTIIALASAVFGGAAAQAQSVVLYGLIDASGSRTKPAGGDARWQLDSGNLQHSFLGFRGSEDLGGGLRAVFRLESYLGMDTGTIGRSASDGLFSREAHVGLSGAFGTTVLGRTVSPLYLSTVNFNPFGESMAFAPATRHWFAGAVLGDRNWNNSLSYTNSAADAPMRVNVAANLHEKTVSSASTGRNYGGSISYITGPFAATLAAERIQNSALGLPVGFDHQVAVQVGATYDFKLLRVYGQVGRVKTNAASDSKVRLVHVGAAVPLGSSVILVAYGESQTRTPLGRVNDRIASLGYDYFLSKNTDIYVAAAYQKVTDLSTGSTLAGGIRMRF